MKKALLALMVLLGLTVFTGCPDYSHLRDVPDYKNMDDTGDELAGEDSKEE